MSQASFGTRPALHSAVREGVSLALKIGLLTCMVLGIASSLRGEISTADPPPRPPPWAAEELSGPFEVVHAQAEEAGLVPGNETGGLTAGVGADGFARNAEAYLGHTSRRGDMGSTPSAAAGLPVWLEEDGAAPMSDLWLVPKLFRPDNYQRHQGEGEPLIGASWLNRPYYSGFFIGALHGDTLIPGEINQSIGFFGGFRLGWDYDTYWALETRLGFSELGLDFIDEPSVDGLAADIVVWDASLVYYPWGDSRWRPYFTAGIGLVDYDFLDELGLRHSDAVVGVPWGVGLKYRHSDWIALRFDFLDNVAFGGRAGFETMNNLSLTGGLEFRFGGTRKSYFPWNPSRTIR